MNTDHWITAVLALRKAKHAVVFTGAGISAESGIPTFRDSDGFWQRFPPERFATWKGLLQTAISNPRSVAEFVLNVVEPIATATANAGHQAVADLQQRVKTSGLPGGDAPDRCVGCRGDCDFGRSTIR